LLPKLGVDINNLNLTDLQSLLPKLGISDETDLEDNSDLLIIAILLGLGYSIEQIRRLFPNIQLGPRPDLDPNAPNAANPGLDEAIDQLLRDNRIPGLEAIPNPDFDPNNVNQPGNTPIIPAQPPLETGEERPAEDYVNQASPPWRGTPTIEDGDSKKGWQHIDERHVTGNAPSGAGDLFAPGTTRAQLDAAAREVVKNGTRASSPSKTVQVFEDRITVNGRRDRVRVIVDTSTGAVVTIFPVRSE
jgi:hypothetical protein